MELVIFTLAAIVIISIIICSTVIRRVKKQIHRIVDVLTDIKAGNGNRRILSAADELTSPWVS